MNEKAIRVARDDARDLIVFADGLDCGGLPEYARRARVVARELLDALDALDAERSARTALQERCERIQTLLTHRTDEAMR